MPLFSKRHKRALASGELRVELERALRVRIWRLMERHDDSYRDEYNNYASHLQDLNQDLLDTYGVSQLSVREGFDGQRNLSLGEWVRQGPAYGLLDAVEGYQRHIPEWDSFCSSVNGILKEEEATWRLLESEFVPLDSVFVHENIIASSQASLQSVRFSGAAQEMQNAQNALVDGNGRAVAHNAGSAFESVMKAVLGKENLTAKQLASALLEEGFFDDVPEEHRKGFVEKVIGAVPWMRNNLGGHGQGRDTQPLAEPYARLAFSLAAVVNEFIVSLAVERDGSLVKSDSSPAAVQETITEQSFASTGSVNDDIPFSSADEDIPF